MLRPTRRLVILLAMGLGVAGIPVMFGRGTWPVWAVSLAACLLAAAWDATQLPRLPGVTLSLDAPREMPVGETDTASIEVSGRIRRGARLDLLVDLSADLAVQPKATATFAGTHTRFAVALQPRRRGRGVIESIWLRVTGPLGLVVRVFKLPSARTIEILPNVRGGKRGSFRYDGRRDGRTGVKVERFDGDGSEFDALREFRVGDDHRTIDWKSSARHRSLLRRQFRAERDHQVVVALDTGRLMAARLNGIPKLDHAVGAALRLANVALRTGDRVGVFGFDESPRLRCDPRGGLHAHLHLLKAVSTLEAREVETNFTLGLSALLRSLRRRSLILVLTDFADTVSAELMIDSLRRMKRRHVVVFVALDDPELDAIETSPPVDRRALHRAVVAGALRRERALVLERLRRSGIYPIEASPDQLGAAMISRYLDLKRREVA